MDQKKKEILRRVLAWVYLALFVVVILNLMIFEFHQDIFLFAYVILIVVYLVIFRKPKDTGINENEEENKK